jgi:hypothetical protein
VRQEWLGHATWSQYANGFLHRMATPHWAFNQADDLLEIDELIERRIEIAEAGRILSR